VNRRNEKKGEERGGPCLANTFLTEVGRREKKKRTAPVELLPRTSKKLKQEPNQKRNYGLQGGASALPAAERGKGGGRGPRLLSTSSIPST